MEFVDMFDNKRQNLHKTTERYDVADGEYKQSMHVWIQNDKGEFLIQKRSMLKKVFPGAWSITGGGVDTGETTLQTVERECKEELGIDVDINKTELMLTIKRENNFVDIYLTKGNFDIDKMVLQTEEVDEAKWVSIEEIREMIASHNFAESISFYFEFLISVIEKFNK